MVRVFVVQGYRHLWRRFCEWTEACRKIFDISDASKLEFTRRDGRVCRECAGDMNSRSA